MSAGMKTSALPEAWKPCKLLILGDYHLSPNDRSDTVRIRHPLTKSQRLETRSGALKTTQAALPFARLTVILVRTKRKQKRTVQIKDPATENKKKNATVFHNRTTDALLNSCRFGLPASQSFIIHFKSFSRSVKNFFTHVEPHLYFPFVLNSFFLY